MPGVFLLAPGPVFQDPNSQSVHSNATITASGSQVFTGYGASEVSLFINVKASPTGTLPTLQYTIQEVDPGDGTTVIGTTVSSTVINAIGIQRITMESAFGGSIKVSWTIGGTGSPTFTQVYATLVAKAASIKLVDSSGLAISGSNPLKVDPTGTTTQPVSGTVTAQQPTAANLNATVTQGPAANLAGYWTVRVTDGTNTLPTGDAVGRAIFQKITDGTNTASVTASSALKVDGSAVTQPVSGTVTANIGTTNGLALDTTLTGGSAKAIVRGGAKGTTTAADVTSANVDANTQALHVYIAGGGGSGGTSSSFGAAFPSLGTAGGFYDGTNMQGARVFDADTGAGTQYVIGVSLRKSASGGSVDFGTSSDPIRIDPTGTTTQPVSGTVTVQQATASNLNAVVTQGPAANLAGYWTVRVTDGTNTMPTGDAVGRAIFHKITDGTNTAAVTASSALKVDGSAVTQPVSGTVTSNQGTAAGAGAPWSVELSDGASFYTGAKTGQFPSALVGGRLDVNMGAWLGSTAPTVGQKTSANSVPIVIASDQSRLPISTEVQLDYDTGAGTQNLSLVGLALPASGGAVAGGTASNPIRTDPTGTTTQPVSGTVTANQGTAAALSGGWPVKVTDGTNTLPTMDVAARAAFIKLTDGTNTTAVKAASTAAAAADPSAVVALSPNSPLPAGSNVVGGVTQSGTWTVQQGTPPWQVVGPGASGAAVTGNPVIMGGSDGTNARYISVDSSGRQVMVGAAASGAAVAGNPVLMGGSDGTNARSIITDTNGRIVVVSPTAANFNATARILGNAGSVLDATLAAGTAPSNGLGVLSQYNTTQPAPTNGQTLSLQSDQAGNLLAFPGVQTKAGSAWNSATANNTLQFPTGTSSAGSPLGAAAVLVQLNQTTTLTGGAVTFEGTYDGSNWVTIPTDQVVNPQTLVALTNPYTFVASTNQPFLIVLQGFQQVRARLSTVITGTGTVTPNWTVIQELVSRLHEGVTGTTPPAQTAQVGGSDGTNLRTLLTDSAGRLVVISDGAATSFPTVITSNAATVHSNATITTSGSTIITSNIWGVQQLNLVVNVKNAPTGTSPTLTYTIQEVDAGDGSTVFGNTVSTASITAAGVYTISIATTSSNAIKVSWTVTGTTPSFTGVYATVISKVTPATQATSSSPATTVPGIASGTVVTTSTANTAVRASTYNEQTTNAQRSVSSASANDTSAGTGARQIQITYLDSTGAGPSTETVTLNGTTAVNTVSSTICYIESIVVTSVGSTGSNVGTLTLFVATAGGGGTLATVNATDNRTFWAHHYVASSKTCKVTGLSGNNTSASNGSVLTIRAKTPLTSATAPDAQVGDFVRVGGGTSQPVRQYGTPISVAGPARILVYEACEGTPSITTRAAFDFYDQ